MNRSLTAALAALIGLAALPASAATLKGQVYLDDDSPIAWVATGNGQDVQLKMSKAAFEKFSKLADATVVLQGILKHGTDPASPLDGGIFSLRKSAPIIFKGTAYSADGTSVTALSAFESDPKVDVKFRGTQPSAGQSIWAVGRFLKSGTFYVAKWSPVKDTPAPTGTLVSRGTVTVPMTPEPVSHGPGSLDPRPAPSAGATR